MISSDEKRLIEILEKEWNEVRLPNAIFCSNLLKIYDASRAFRETGELREGDLVDVQLSDGTFKRGTYVGCCGIHCAVNHNPHHLNIGWYRTTHVFLTPKTERRLMGDVELMQWFRDNGWKVDNKGNYNHPTNGQFFTPFSWQYCGKKIEEFHKIDYPADWVKEVEVL